LKAAKEKQQVTYRGKPMRLIADLSTYYANRAWDNIFQALKENSCQPGLVYPAKLEGVVKVFQNNKN
jgi:hypothetical protein